MKDKIYIILILFVLILGNRCKAKSRNNSNYFIKKEKESEKKNLRKLQDNNEIVITIKGKANTAIKFIDYYFAHEAQEIQSIDSKGNVKDNEIKFSDSDEHTIKIVYKDEFQFSDLSKMFHMCDSVLSVDFSNLIHQNSIVL